MAERVNGKDVDWYRQGYRYRYPWHDWLNGDVWVLTVGVDFTEDVATFRRWVNHLCRRDRGHKVRTRLWGDQLFIQALPDNPVGGTYTLDV